MSSSLAILVAFKTVSAGLEAMAARRCDAWTDDSSPSPRNWGGSQHPKNEETSAGQQDK